MGNSQRRCPRPPLRPTGLPRGSGTQAGTVGPIGAGSLVGSAQGPGPGLQKGPREECLSDGGQCVPVAQHGALPGSCVMLGQSLSLSETQPPHLSHEHIPLGDPAAIYPPFPPARRRQLTLGLMHLSMAPGAPAHSPGGGGRPQSLPRAGDRGWRMMWGSRPRGVAAEGGSASQAMVGECRGPIVAHRGLGQRDKGHRGDTCPGGQASEPREAFWKKNLVRAGGEGRGQEAWGQSSAGLGGVIWARGGRQMPWCHQDFS